MIRRPPRSTLDRSSAASDVYKRQVFAFAELNSDTPTGEAEAIVLNRVVHPSHPETDDPNATLEATYCEMVEGLARYTLGAELSLIHISEPTRPY